MRPVDVREGKATLRIPTALDTPKTYRIRSLAFVRNLKAPGLIAQVPFAGGWYAVVMCRGSFGWASSWTLWKKCKSEKAAIAGAQVYYQKALEKLLEEVA